MTFAQKEGTMRWAWRHVDGSTALKCAQRGALFDPEHCRVQWWLWFRLIDTPTEVT